ncbi:MAG TPA: hypothetical protein VG940_02615, partial [Gemmatimonadales bacterium]|nr:hypothetical protein [Gemmatimonadales bacterium]
CGGPRDGGAGFGGRTPAGGGLDRDRAVRRIALLSGALSLAASTAVAQGSIDPNSVFRLRPRSCPVADSLAGRPLERPRENAFGWAAGEQGMVVSNGIWETSGRPPFDAIILTAIFRGLEPGTPHPDASFALQLRMKDTVLRQGAATDLTLQFDDSTEVDLGWMEVTTGPMSSGRTIDQVLTVALPASTVRKIATTSTLRGRLGATPFPVPPKSVEQMHSAFIAATCGARIR